VGVISIADDYPLHQTSRPFRDPGTDVNLYDRFFFCGYPTEGEQVGQVYFAAAFGIYPGRNIVDGAFSVIVDGVQHNVRGSRLMGPNRLDLNVGPITIEIVEPLKKLRVLIDAPEAGITAELTFTARGPAFEEPHYRWSPGHLTVFDITRMTQNGTWSGWIDVPDGTGSLTSSKRLNVSAHTWLGTRDRSWGIRPIGPRATNMAPDGPPPGFYWLWAPMNFPDQNVIFDVNETTEGQRWHENAAASVAAFDSNGSANSADITTGAHTYEIDWRSGTRHADTFTTVFSLPDRTLTYTLKSALTFYMSGIGYGHPEWGHGTYVGPNERRYDTYVLADVNEADPVMFNHVQILSHATRADSQTRLTTNGLGILEMLISGPHAPSGFSGYVDVAP
jgi:hypothetical protein